MAHWIWYHASKHILLYFVLKNYAYRKTNAVYSLDYVIRFLSDVSSKKYEYLMPIRLYNG